MVTLGKVSVFVYELIPEPVTDTTPNLDASALPEVIESTMLMPAWQKTNSKAGEAVKARRPKHPVQPDEVEPVAQAAPQELREPPPEQLLSSGRSFHRKYLAALQAGNLEDLLGLYHPDATLLSADAAFMGIAGIATFFRQYFGGVGLQGRAGRGTVEGPSSLFVRVSRRWTPAPGFTTVCAETAKATHHFTFSVVTTSKSAGP
jgi:hypothetical protein